MARLILAKWRMLEPALAQNISLSAAIHRYATLESAYIDIVHLVSGLTSYVPEYQPLPSSYIPLTAIPGHGRNDSLWPQIRAQHHSKWPVYAHRQLHHDSPQLTRYLASLIFVPQLTILRWCHVPGIDTESCLRFHHRDCDAPVGWSRIWRRSEQEYPRRNRAGIVPT
ncbi:hypothetical protein HGRIS_010508 [Hohenbuehelia grisea]|uniref:Uncharacterized protein n=1 Tax=Hohenbuehelia grisea TaxID=104357 RepID=A0ABR3IX65_9AGAR